MIIERIQLTNLFSYCGPQRFELGQPGPGRNICLIMGQNGFGKTSLLNALKLLFTGACNEPLRRAVQRKRMPTVQQYVLGAGDDWWGIMNRRARIDGETRCAVELRWTENGQMVRAERSWTIEGDTWQEQLAVQAGEARFDDEAAQEFLDRRLPPDYVDFFFFDGEQIQALAEANRDTQQREMERILGIGAIDALREALKQSVNGWQRNELKPEAKAELQRLEGSARALSEELRALEDTQAILEQEVEDDQEELRRVRRRIEGVSAYVHRHDENELKQALRRIQAEFADGRERLSAELPRDVVLLANPSLVRRAIDRLDQVLRSDAGARSRVLETLTRTLPERLFDGPDRPDPDIREGQRAFYQYKLVRLLEKDMTDAGSVMDPNFAPDPQAGARARDQLAPYAEAEGLRTLRAEALRRLQQQTAELRKLETDLLNVGSLSDEERKQFERYVEERDQLERALTDKQQRIGALENEFGQKQRKLDETKKMITEIQSVVQAGGIAKDKIYLARRLGSLFSKLKDQRKKEQREALENAINRHFRLLMTSHHLIDKIEVDDEFGLHYLDRDGHPIAMGALSAGMKQLMATALLWALSEASGKQVPVIIDTPLARIDAGNQKAILTQYYPNAADQVIVLPTDSELDARKLGLVAEHVYAAFRLTNPDGEHTVPVAVDVAELAAGV
ncbi:MULTISPECIES: DNA sulfur modification protein DndD [Thiorhodovibrio]|uniref:DNA sulfur modification protein DndD n=1 Tax=Thiorhodovibrio TaxID=61593 RepID=UPI0019120275|nr:MULTISPECIES: DNA sulfur modification protein DndD [Thiorhodovibrio]MBK5970037.1 DNA sulfur modification protein DndD [Thiorhodovibrio winogradskyi]WPL12964.1 chromosome segregation protein [Thiorhodovibrio litoralis]